MKSNELKKKNGEELEKLLTEKLTGLRTFRFDISGSKARNVKEGRNLRKDAARILTEINFRRLPQASETVNGKQVA